MKKLLCVIFQNLSFRNYQQYLSTDKIFIIAVSEFLWITTNFSEKWGSTILLSFIFIFHNAKNLFIVYIEKFNTLYLNFVHERYKVITY